MLFKDLSILIDFEMYLEEKHKLSDVSRYMYKKAIEFFLLSDPNLEDVEDYNRHIIKHAIKKRNNTIYAIFKAFIKFKIKDANKRNQMIENLIKPDVPSTVKQERKYLDEKELIKIINALKDTKHKIIALIQDLTGVRAGDVLKIKRGSVMPEIYADKNVLKIIVTGKGNKRNVIYIHEEMVQVLIVDYLIKNINSTEYYFMEDKTLKGAGKEHWRRMYKANHMAYYRDLKFAMDACGLEFKDFATHDYRRCFARRVWTRYKDVQVLQELLNHQNPATTMRYLKQSGMKNVDYHKELQTM